MEEKKATKKKSPTSKVKMNVVEKKKEVKVVEKKEYNAEIIETNEKPTSFENVNEVSNIESTDDSDVTNLKKENEETSTNEEEKETYKEMSPIRLILRRFFRSKLSIVGLVIIVFLFVFSFLGPTMYNSKTREQFGFGWDETEVDRSPVVEIVENPYTYTDPEGVEIEVIQQVEIHKSINDKAAPSWIHPLGTDDKGMDVFARLMYGGRISKRCK